MRGACLIYDCVAAKQYETSTRSRLAACTCCGAIDNHAGSRMHVPWQSAHQDATCVVVFQPGNTAADIWLMLSWC